MQKKILEVLLSLTLLSGIFSGVQEVHAQKTNESSQMETKEVYLSDLEWSNQICGASQDFPNGTAINSSINGEDMRLLVNGIEQIFYNGLGAHAPSINSFISWGNTCCEICFSRKGKHRWKFDFGLCNLRL